MEKLAKDDWGGYERVLPPEVEHIIGKDQTQQLYHVWLNTQDLRTHIKSYTNCRGRAAVNPY